MDFITIEEKAIVHDVVFSFHTSPWFLTSFIDTSAHFWLILFILYFYVNFIEVSVSAILIFAYKIYFLPLLAQHVIIIYIAIFYTVTN